MVHIYCMLLPVAVVVASTIAVEAIAVVNTAVQC